MCIFTYYGGCDYRLISYFPRLKDFADAVVESASYETLLNSLRGEDGTLLILKRKVQRSPRRECMMFRFSQKFLCVFFIMD